MPANIRIATQFELWPQESVPVSKPKTRKYRSRTCEKCGSTDIVRADNPATCCSTCASRENGRRGLARLQDRLSLRPRIQATCPQCGRLFPTTNYAIRKTKIHCCSLKCRRLFSGIERTCKWCGGNFRALRSRVKGITRSNSSAHF